MNVRRRILGVVVLAALAVWALWPRSSEQKAALVAPEAGEPSEHSMPPTAARRTERPGDTPSRKPAPRSGDVASPVVSWQSATYVAPEDERQLWDAEQRAVSDASVSVPGGPTVRWRKQSCSARARAQIRGEDIGYRARLLASCPSRRCAPRRSRSPPTTQRASAPRS